MPSPAGVPAAPLTPPWGLGSSSAEWGQWRVPPAGFLGVGASQGPIRSTAPGACSPRPAFQAGDRVRPMEPGSRSRVTLWTTHASRDAGGDGTPAADGRCPWASSGGGEGGPPPGKGLQSLRDTPGPGVCALLWARPPGRHGEQEWSPGRDQAQFTSVTRPSPRIRLGPRPGDGPGSGGGTRRPLGLERLVSFVTGEKVWGTSLSPQFHSLALPGPPPGCSPGCHGCGGWATLVPAQGRPRLPGLASSRPAAAAALAPGPPGGLLPGQGRVPPSDRGRTTAGATAGACASCVSCCCPQGFCRCLGSPTLCQAPGTQWDRPPWRDLRDMFAFGGSLSQD